MGNVIVKLVIVCNNFSPAERFSFFQTFVKLIIPFNPAVNWPIPETN